MKHTHIAYFCVLYILIFISSCDGVERSLNTTSLTVLTPKDTCSTSQDMELMPRALSAQQRRQFLQRNKLKAKPNAYPVTGALRNVQRTAVYRGNQMHYRPELRKYPKGAVYTRYKIPPMYVTFRCPPKVGLLLCRASCERRSKYTIGSCDNGYCTCLLLKPGFRGKGVFVRRANCYMKADRVKCTKFCVYQFGRSAQGLCNADRCRCFTNPKISPKNQLTACEQARRRLAFLEARLRNIMRKEPSSRTLEERRFLQEVSKNPRVIQRINSSRRPRKTKGTAPRRVSSPRFTNFQSIQKKAPNARNSPRKSPAKAIKFVTDPKGPQFPANRKDQRRSGQSPGKGITGARQSPKISRNPPMNARPNPGKGGPKSSSPKFRQPTPRKRQDGHVNGNNRNSQTNPPRRNGVAQSPKKSAPTPKLDPKRGGSPKIKQTSPKQKGSYAPTSKDMLPPSRGRPVNDHKARDKDKFQESPPSGYGGQKEQARPQNAGRGGGEGGGGRVPTPGKGVNDRNGGGKSPDRPNPAAGNRPHGGGGGGNGAGYKNPPKESSEEEVDSKEEVNNGRRNGGGRTPGNNGYNGGHNGGGRTPGNNGQNGGRNGGGRTPGNNGQNGSRNGGGRTPGNNGYNGGHNGGGRTPGNSGYHVGPNGGGKSPVRPNSGAGNKQPGGGGGGNYPGARKGAPYGNSDLTSSEEINSREDDSSEPGGYGGKKKYPYQTGPAKTNPQAPLTTPNGGNRNGNGKDGTGQNPYRTPSRPNSQSGNVHIDANTGQTVPPNRVIEDAETGKQVVVPPGNEVVTNQETGEQMVVPAGTQVTQDAQTGEPVVVPPGQKIDPLTGHTYLPNHTGPKPVITDEGACPQTPGNHQDPKVPPHNEYENHNRPPPVPGHQNQNEPPPVPGYQNQNEPPPVPGYQNQNGPQLDQYGRPIIPLRDDYQNPQLDQYGRPIIPLRDDYQNPQLDQYGRPIIPLRDDYQNPQLDQYGRPIPPRYEDPMDRGNGRYNQDDQYDEPENNDEDENPSEDIDPDLIDPRTLGPEDREIWRQMKREKDAKLRAEAEEYEHNQRYQNNNPGYQNNNQRHQNDGREYAGNEYGRQGDNRIVENQGGYQRNNRDY